jgi:hypothetical protein
VKRGPWRCGSGSPAEAGGQGRHQTAAPAGRREAAPLVDTEDREPSMLRNAPSPGNLWPKEVEAILEQQDMHPRWRLLSIRTLRLATMGRRSYWNLRAKLRRAVFFAARTVFGARLTLEQSRESLGTLAQVTRAILPQLARASIALAGIELVAVLGERMRWVESWPGVFGRIVDGEPQTTLLLSVAGLGAALLGLYYTALSVVLSTTYAAAPSVVRNLFLRERGTRGFANALCLLTVLCLALAVEELLEHSLPRLSIPLVLAAAIYSALALVVFGAKAFHFFDPASLGHSLQRSFISWLGKATSRGLFWRDPSFQTHYRSQARGALDAYSRLLDYVQRERPRDPTQTSALAVGAIRMLELHSRRKPEIPQDSLWYERILEHPDWLSTSSAMYQIALNTATDLPPAESPNRTWVEDALREVVISAATHLTREGERGELSRLAQYAHDAAGRLAGRFQVSEALGIGQFLSDAWWSRSREDPPAKESEAWLHELQVGSFYSYIPVSALLALTASTVDINTRFIVTTVERMRAGHPAARISGLTPETARYYEWVRERLAFEESIEGNRLTRDWWLQHTVAQSICASVVTLTEQVLAAGQQMYATTAEELLRTGHNEEAAGLILTGWQFVNKLEFHLPRVSDMILRLEPLKVLEDKGWPAADLSDLERGVQEHREKLRDLLVKMTPRLAPKEFTGRSPDLFGRSYATLTNECLRAMLDGKESEFLGTCRALVVSSIAASERLRDKLDPQSEDLRAAMLVGEPIVDIIEISGYAFLLTELGIGEFWKPCTEVWDALLKADTAEHTLRFIEKTLLVREDLLLGMPRDESRMIRRRWFDEKLAEMGVHVAAWPFAHDRHGTHSSAVIRCFSRSGGPLSNYSPEVLFVVKYISKRKEVTDYRMTRAADEMQQAIERGEDPKDA